MRYLSTRISFSIPEFLHDNCPFLLVSNSKSFEYPASSLSKNDSFSSSISPSYNKLFSTDSFSLFFASIYLSNSSSFFFCSRTSSRYSLWFFSFTCLTSASSCDLTTLKAW